MKRAITLPMVAGLVGRDALRVWDAVSEARIEGAALIPVPFAAVSFAAVADPRFLYDRWRR